MAEETADCIERLRRELQGLRESDVDLQATLQRALDVLGEMHRARQASATPAKAAGAAGSVCSDVSDADTDDSACGSLASPTSEPSGGPCAPRGDDAVEAPSPPSESASPTSARDDHEDARSDSECSVVSTDSGFGRAAGSGQPASSSAPPPQRFQRNLRRAQLPERWKRAVERKRAERKLTAARSLPSLCHEDGSPVPQQQQQQQQEEPEREDWTEALLSGSRTRQPLVLGDNSFADLVHNWMDLPDICNGGTARAAQTRQQQQQQNPKSEKESKRPTGLARLLSIPEQIRKRFSSSSSSSSGGGGGSGLGSRADKSRTVKKTRHLSIYELDDMDSFFDELPPHGARQLGQRHSHPCMVGSLSQPDVCSFVGSHLEDSRRLSSHFRSVVWV
ncbi:uncharacterized protein LOC144947217 [Lampetra fluviatilis]